MCSEKKVWWEESSHPQGEGDGGFGKKMGHPLIMSCLCSLCKYTAVLASVFIVLSVSFAIGTMTEINQLRIALQESATARNITEGQCISLKVDCLCCLNHKDEN